MVARGAGAAWPVLLACRKWDPLGLARRLPSRGACAWRGAPLLPWRVQCPGLVCVALAAGLGGWGPVRVLCLPRFPLPAPRFPRFVWRAVLSGCPLSSLAGTPFHAVCAFRGLGPVAHSGIPRVSFVCACARPPPPSPGRRSARTSRCWAPSGPFNAIRAPPRVLPRSPAPFGLLLGGTARSCPPPCLAWGCVPPLGQTPARTLASWLCVLWGQHEGASCLCAGLPGSGALPTPTACPLGRAAWAHYQLAVGAGGVGAGTRHQTHRARSCELALRAVGVTRGRPGGGASCLCVGRPGSGISHP